MEGFLEITTDATNTTSAILNTSDPAEANILLRAINEIPTYQIDVVVFDVNVSSRHDEIIAHRLGMAVIDNEQYQHQGDSHRYHVDVKGPKMFTTNDIQGIPFAGVTPLTELRADHHLILDVIVREGNGHIHAKWRPVANAYIQQHEDKYMLVFKAVGMLNPLTILERAYNLRAAAASRTPSNLFMKPVLPKDWVAVTEEQ